MNSNDMDRYFWRTGQRWSGDSRPLRELRGEVYLPARTAWLLLIPAVITGAWLVWTSVTQ